MSELVFDNEINNISHAALTQPFAPVRPDRQARKFEHLNRIEKKLSDIDEKNKTIENFDRIMRERNEKRDRALEKLKKNITNDKNLDRKLKKRVMDDYHEDISQMEMLHHRRLEELDHDDDDYSVADSLVTTTFLDIGEMTRTMELLAPSDDAKEGKASYSELGEDPAECHSDVKDDAENDSMLDQEEDQSDAESESDDGEERASGLALSPRTKYIDGCIRNHINPRPSLILRKVRPKRSWSTLLFIV